MRPHLFAFISLFTLFALATATTPPTDEEIGAMKIKELKAFLKERGKECQACTETKEFREAVKEYRDAPVIETKPAENKKSGGNKIPGGNKDALKEFLKNMKSQGGDVVDVDELLAKLKSDIKQKDGSDEHVEKSTVEEKIENGDAPENDDHEQVEESTGEGKKNEDDNSETVEGEAQSETSENEAESGNTPKDEL